MPRLARATFGEAKADNNGLLSASWRMGDGSTLELLANLSASEIAFDAHNVKAIPIWGGEPQSILPPWSVFWRIGG